MALDRRTVTAIVATYNRERFLPQALDSLLNQSRPPDEIIVINDGSTDGTAELVRGYGSAVCYMEQRNQGKSVALNKAIPVASGDYIWIFDDDDVALPDALEAHLAFLAKHPDVDFSYSTNFVYKDGDDIWDRQRWQLKSLAPCGPEDFLVHTMMGMHAMIPGMLIPRRCYREVGHFDEQLIRAQDLEMLIRLARKFKAADIERATFVLREHSGIRGSASSLHSSALRAEVWYQYRKTIFQKFRQQLSLSEYLPKGLVKDNDTFTAETRSYALMRRFCIMFRQGLFDEGIEDIKSALSLVNVTQHNSRWAVMISGAMNIEPWIIDNPLSLTRSINVVLRESQAMSLKRYFMRGIYWSFRKSLLDHRWRDSYVSLAMLSAMLPGPLSSVRQLNADRRNS